MGSRYYISFLYFSRMHMARRRESIKRMIISDKHTRTLMFKLHKVVQVSSENSRHWGNQILTVEILGADGMGQICVQLEILKVP